ncbi:helix-turn-helix transcriptional regulator [Porticoccus sp.]
MVPKHTVKQLNAAPFDVPEKTGQVPKQHARLVNHPAGMRPAQAAQYLGISRWKLYQLIAEDPDFPRPIRFSLRCVIFPKTVLDSYLVVKQAQEAEL